MADKEIPDERISDLANYLHKELMCEMEMNDLTCTCDRFPGDSAHIIAHACVQYMDIYMQGSKADGLSAEGPSDVELQYLNDRARAYVVGLEAKLKSLREENTQIREEMASGAAERVDKLLLKEYKRGWQDASASFSNQAQAAIHSLRNAQKAAAAAYYTQSEGTNCDQ